MTNPVAELYAGHHRALRDGYERMLTQLAGDHRGVEAVCLHSGSEIAYWADDRPVPFESHAHFSHWIPVNRPDQVILVQPGRRPVWFKVVPRDFWYEQSVTEEAWWAGHFDIVELERPEQVRDHLDPHRRTAFVGQNTRFASQLGIPGPLQNEPGLCNRLDYQRSFKSAYEIACLREANRLAVIAHDAARAAFEAGGGEREINEAYLASLDIIEHDLPYTSIVALDEKSAILHYQEKRAERGADRQLLLIDAGARFNRYAADLTRTWVRHTIHPVMKEIAARVEGLMLELIDDATVGTSYLDLNTKARERVRDMLLELGVIRGSVDQLEAHRVSRLFLPHGVGHLLGLQVHDVSGHFADERGTPAPPPEEHLHLRLTRKLEPGMVCTMEPGIYFIPVLLDPERDAEKGKLLNWELIDQLIPLGGARWEDDFLVTAEGPVNLTREGARAT